MSIVPDFVMIGAQKSGTTSLCAFLESIEGVCIARPKEPMFFSRDEIALHPHFFSQHMSRWHQFDWENRRETLLEEYSQNFSHAKSGDLLGEGSTSYLLSERAPQRLFDLNPNAKIIVALRDPATRAYSAYWHYVKHGIACESFERHLQYEGGLTIQGGEYASHLARWLSVFPRSQCHFIVYRALLEEPVAHLEALCAFLGVPCPPLPKLPQKNSGKSPRMVWLQLMLNQINRRASTPHGAFNQMQTKSWLQHALSPLEQWNLVSAPYAPMPYTIHHALDVHYARANASLQHLTGLDTTPYWYRTLR